MRRPYRSRYIDTAACAVWLSVNQTAFIADNLGALVRRMMLAWQRLWACAGAMYPMGPKRRSCLNRWIYASVANAAEWQKTVRKLSQVPKSKWCQHINPPLK
tara:strand:- start:768 stop:1073 length:306 start_codon:yes stop_codon:yes gene_type:complete